ncbi:ABC transporter permease [Mesoplasma seiffertii]|uniref:ABC transporter permease n=1 Tax=Mesoplasma seiffertii TaxID=28224 RepID=UPI00047A2606|nr:ABC transporter permease subunit [Mesoplasma seiffertii]
MINLHLVKKAIYSNWIAWVAALGASLLVFIIFLSSLRSHNTSENVIGIFGGFLTTLGVSLPLIYLIVTANKLVVIEVEKGDMAYYLSTPLSRVKILVSKMTFFGGSIVCWTLIHFIVGCLFIGVMGLSMPIDLWLIMFLNWTLILLSLGGISWLASCYFNKNSFALIIGAGIPTAFIIIATLASVPELKMEYLKYLTLLSLFKPDKMETTTLTTWLPQVLVLIPISAVLYGAGIYIFKNRDLPL